MRSLILVAFVALLITSRFAPPALAAPPASWLNDGNPLCSAAGRQFAPVAIGDDAGGMIVFWLDQRRGPNDADLYAQRVNASGELAGGWPADGALVLTSIQPARPLVFRDGLGGALVLWGKNGEIRALHLLSDGTLPGGADPAGHVVASGIGGPSWTGYAACPDGDGGAYVLYLDFPSFTTENLRLARVAADGLPVPGWETPVPLWSNYWGFGGYTGFALASPPAGGAIVAFANFSEGPVGGHYYGRAKRLGGGGALLWTQDLNQQLGVEVSSMQLLADDADGAIVRVPSGLSNHLDGSGAATWPVSPPVSSFPVVGGDGSGGAFSIEIPVQTPTLHRLDDSGALPTGWTAAGVPLTSAFDLSAYDIETCPGAILLAWSDAPAGDIRATAITVGGAIAPGWSAGGNLLCRVRGTQTEPTLVPIGISLALVAWTDTRDDEGDIYANRGTGSPPLAVTAAPSALALKSVREAAGGSAIRVAGSLAEPGEARLEVHDIAGRVLYRTTFPAAAGPFERTLSPGRLARGVYWVRLGFGDQAVAAKFLRLE